MNSHLMILLTHLEIKIPIKGLLMQMLMRAMKMKKLRATIQHQPRTIQVKTQLLQTQHPKRRKNKNLIQHLKKRLILMRRSL